MRKWTRAHVNKLYEHPLLDLLAKAQRVHRKHFNPREIQLATLFNFKTGGCPEDCAYCPQSAHYKTGLAREVFTPVEEVIQEATLAKEKGATRFCIGAAWKSPPKKDLPKVLEMIKGIKALGLETCATLGTLSSEQAHELKEAGLDYYNHNLDSSPEFYPTIISTRSYQERLDTLRHVRQSTMKVCCGGIIGMGENREDRVGLLLQLANQDPPPESVPINRLIPVTGTPLAHQSSLDNFEFIRTIAITRILMPHSHVRLSAGRSTMSSEMQALCFLAGANSIHYGKKLLVTPNAEEDQDNWLLKTLGLIPQSLSTIKSTA